MYALDLAALRATPLNRQPFQYLVVPGFVKAEARPAINADFPDIANPGSFPVRELTYGPAFAALLEALQGAAMPPCWRPCKVRRCGPPLKKNFSSTCTTGRR
jgi:hypothetical protein